MSGNQNRKDPERNGAMILNRQFTGENTVANISRD